MTEISLLAKLLVVLIECIFGGIFVFYISTVGLDENEKV